MGLGFRELLFRFRAPSRELGGLAVRVLQGSGLKGSGFMVSGIRVLGLPSLGKVWELPVKLPSGGVTWEP